MKAKIFKRLFIIVMPALIGLGFIEYRLHQLDSIYSIKKKNLESRLESTRGLILGNSHAVYNYSPQTIPLKTFNFANISQSLEIDQTLLKQYLPKLPNLCFVLFNLSYFSFEHTLTGNRDNGRNFLYYKNFGFYGDARWWETLKFSKWSLLFIYSVKMIRKFVFSGLKDIKHKTIGPWGGVKPENSKIVHLPINMATGKARADYHTSIMLKPLAKPYLKSLNNLVQRLDQKKIIPFFVRSPAFKTYTSHLDPESETRFIELSGGLTRPFYDFHTDPRFVKSDFINNDHLDRKGSEKFTQILIREVLSPFLDKCPEIN